MTSRRPNRRAARAPTTWEPVAEWYVGWSGARGSRYHRALAIPAALDLLALARGERVLDLGAGPGALAREVARAGARYVGVDLSDTLLRAARRYHGRHGEFVRADARRLPSDTRFVPASFDAVVFLLSIQDMEPLEAVIASAAWALRPGGRIVLLMTHPCFRVPRQSGWGRDARRRLWYRRVDRYLTPLAAPMQPYPRQRGATRTFHRPLAAYVNALAERGLLVDRMREIPPVPAVLAKDAPANPDIPLFLGLRARKAGRS